MILLISLCTLSTQVAFNPNGLESIPVEGHDETVRKKIFDDPMLIQLILKNLDDKSFTKLMSVNQNIQRDGVLAEDASHRKESKKRKETFQKITSEINVYYPHGAGDVSERTIDFTDYSISFRPKYIDTIGSGEGNMEAPCSAGILIESFNRDNDPAFIVKFEVAQRGHIQILYFDGGPIQHVTIYLDYSREENFIERTECRYSYPREFEICYEAKASNFKIEIPNTFNAAIFKGQRFPCTSLSIRLDEENPKLQFEILQ